MKTGLHCSTEQVNTVLGTITNRWHLLLIGLLGFFFFVLFSFLLLFYIFKIYFCFSFFLFKIVWELKSTFKCSERRYQRVNFGLLRIWSHISPHRWKYRERWKHSNFNNLSRRALLEFWRLVSFKNMYHWHSESQ